MTRKEDMRARHSKEKINQAFRDLLKEKGFAKTTVSDIIKRANVNRSTFYAHYTDKFDLLDKFEDELFLNLAHVSKAIPENFSESDFIYELDFKDYIEDVLTIISDNKEVFFILSDSVQGTNFQKKLFAYMNNVWRSHNVVDKLQVDAAYVQIATVGMICSLIESWIEDGCEPTVADFGAVVSDIVGAFIEGVTFHP